MRFVQSSIFITVLAILFSSYLTTACVRIKNDNQNDKGEIVEKNSLYILGFSLKTSFTNDQVEKDVEKLWKYFEEDFDAQLFHSRADDKMYMVMFNYEENESGNFEILLGYNVKNPHSKLKSKYASAKIPKGKYFHKIIDGTSEEDVAEAWNEIFTSEIKRSFEHDFEVYSFDSDFEINKVEIFTSVME